MAWIRKQRGCQVSFDTQQWERLVVGIAEGFGKPTCYLQAVPKVSSKENVIGQLRGTLRYAIESKGLEIIEAVYREVVGTYCR